MNNQFLESLLKLLLYRILNVFLRGLGWVEGGEMGVGGGTGDAGGPCTDRLASRCAL